MPDVDSLRAMFDKKPITANKPHVPNIYGNKAIAVVEPIKEKKVSVATLAPVEKPKDATKPTPFGALEIPSIFGGKKQEPMIKRSSLKDTRP